MRTCCLLEQCVNERCDRRTLHEHQQTAQQTHHDDDGEQPKFFARAEKIPQLFDDHFLTPLELLFDGLWHRSRRLTIDPVRLGILIELQLE